MRKLASIRKIGNLQPIKDADRIELAIVDGWKVVVNKGDHNIGDLVVYFEIDSLLPIQEEFEFLRKSSYKMMSDGTEGFRLKTIRLRGQVSQGLVVPTTVLPAGVPIIEGEDVTDILGVVKYEPPIPPELEGKVIGQFPSFIQKTDEERIQNFADEYSEMRKFRYFASEKLDGTSCTMFFNEKFGICSRNLEFAEGEGTQWRLASETGVMLKMENLGRNIALQGEIIGEGIQKNKYKLIGQEFRLFNIFDIDNYEYLPKNEMLEIAEQFGLKIVPTVFESVELPETIDEILILAEGKSILNPQSEREGLVWVSVDSPKRISFKTISNRFLLKYE